MKRGSISEILKKKDGVALVTVMVVFLTLVIVVVAATMMAHSNFLRTQKTTNLSSAYYVAESGLNETIDDFKAYYESLSTPKSGLEIESEFKNLITMEDDSKRIEYGNVMNQEAWADTAFSYEGTDGDIMLFRLASNGHLVDTSRSVETFIRLRVATDPTDGTEGTYYQPDAVLLLDQSATPSNLNIGDFPSIGGPIITNRPIYISNGAQTTMSGPIVTNKNITFNKKITSGNPKPVFITSGNVLVTISQDVTIHAIVLKGNGTFINTQPSNSTKVNYLLVPYDMKDKEYLIDTSNRTTIDHIIFYDPNNFDPFEDVLQSNKGQIIQNHLIFGQDPELEGSSIVYDYRDYFKDDFVLDNVEDYESYVPKVKLPDRPIYEDVKPLVSTISPITITGSSNNQYTIVDANLNYKTSNVWNKPSVFPINPGLFSEHSDFKYNSMYLEGGHNSSDPTRIFIGDKDISIVTKSLHIDRYIEIIGTGSLRIYVVGNGDKITSSNLNIVPVSINTRDSLNGSYTNDPSKLQIVVYETTDSNGKGLTLTTTNWGSNPLYATFFTQNMNLEIGGSFDSIFVSAEGTSVKVPDYGTHNFPLLFVPQADLTISGSAHVTGAVVAKNVSISGGAKIDFNSTLDKSFVDTILADFIFIEGTGGDSGGSTPGTPGSPGSVGEFTISPIREVD